MKEFITGVSLTALIALVPVLLVYFFTYRVVKIKMWRKGSPHETLKILQKIIQNDFS